MQPFCAKRIRSATALRLGASAMLLLGPSAALCQEQPRAAEPVTAAVEPMEGVPSGDAASIYIAPWNPELNSGRHSANSVQNDSGLAAGSGQVPKYRLPPLKVDSISPEMLEKMSNATDTSAYPWVGFVISSSGGLCTATLIAPSALLTAAHCFSAPIAPSNQCVADARIGGVQVSIGGQNYFNATATINGCYDGGARNDQAVVNLAPGQSISNVPQARVLWNTSYLTNNQHNNPGFVAVGMGQQCNWLVDTSHYPFNPSGPTSQCHQYQSLGNAYVKRKALPKKLTIDTPDFTTFTWTSTNESDSPNDAPGRSCSGDSGGPLLTPSGQCVMSTAVGGWGFLHYGGGWHCDSGTVHTRADIGLFFIMAAIVPPAGKVKRFNDYDGTCGNIVYETSGSNPPPPPAPPAFAVPLYVPVLSPVLIDAQ